MSNLSSLTSPNCAAVFPLKKTRSDVLLITFFGPEQLCFPVEQHVGALFALELLLYVRLSDRSHSGVIQVKPVATLLTDRRTHRGKTIFTKASNLTFAYSAIPLLLVGTADLLLADGQNQLSLARLKDRACNSVPPDLEAPCSDSVGFSSERLECRLTPT